MTLLCILFIDAERKIQQQSFFHGIDWKRMESRNVKPPFLPRVRNAKDSSNFDSEFTREATKFTLLKKDEIKMINQQDFVGFSYRNEHFQT